MVSLWPSLTSIAFALPKAARSWLEPRNIPYPPSTFKAPQIVSGFTSNTMPTFDPSNYFNQSKTAAREEVLRQMLADLQVDHPESHVLITHDGDKVKVQRSDSVASGHVDLYNQGLIQRTYGYDWWVFKQARVEYKGSTK